MNVVSINQILSDSIDFGSEYLSLDFSKHPNVNNWKVIEINETGKTATKLNNNQKYFSRNILKNSSSQFYFAGFDADDNELLRTVIIGNDNNPQPLCPGCGFFELACSKVCVGPDYSWQLNIYENMATPDLYYMSLQSTLFKHYSYVNSSTVNSIDDTGQYSYGPINTNDSSRVFCTPNGDFITGSVVGLVKDISPWAFMTSDLIIGPPPCNESLSTIILRFNSGGAGVNFGSSSPLICGSTPCTVAANSTEGVSGGGVSPDPCSQISSVTFGPNDDFFQSYNTFWECKEREVGGSFVPWQDDVDVITISDLIGRENGQKYAPIIIKVDEAFDEKGNWIFHEFKIENGLYVINTLTKSGRNINLIKEIDNVKGTLFTGKKKVNRKSKKN